MNLQSSIVSQFVSDYFYWVFIAILFVNMTQRKYQKTAGKKRMATLYLAIVALVLYATGHMALLYGFGDVGFVIVAVLVGAAVYVMRARTLPFTLTCRRTGRRLDMHNILYNDSNSFPETYDEDGTDIAADD